MDFIDPDKQHSHKIRLLIGYCLMAIAIILTSVILLYQANGYGIGSNGEIIQNGLVFLSSTPNPAQISLNGVLNTSKTNVRLQLPAGLYTVSLNRNGYVPWVRAIGVEGGSVEHFDYPFLIPSKLVSNTIQQFDATNQTVLITQSPDRRWLMVQQPQNPTDFFQYDTSVPPTQLSANTTTVSVPKSLVNSDTTGSTWHVVQWSTDNVHVLLLHTFKSGHEYILFNRQTPTSSINLSTQLTISDSTQITLIDGKFDQYYLFDPQAQTLFSANLSITQPTLVLSQIYTFKSYGSNVLLFITSLHAPPGKLNVDLLQNGTTYVIRQVPVAANYLLDLTQYSGSWFIVSGASSENRVYVYKNPVTTLSSQPPQPLVPITILKVNQPNYVAFSATAQFIVAEGGANFGVYDAENDETYNYKLNIPVQSDQHATWMDGNRLTLVSNNKVVLFDYDDANQQNLNTAVNGTTAFFDTNYKWLYSLAPVENNTNQSGTTGNVTNLSGSASGSSQSVHSSSISSEQFILNDTALRIPSDQ